MSVNNERVRQIINDAIAHSTNNGDRCCGAIRQAWAKLKRWRDIPPNNGSRANSLDLDVAAAENYLFARTLVCEGLVSRFQMNIMAIAYYTSKVIGVEMPASGNPQSEPELGVLGWGGIGSEEGEADRRRCNPNINPPIWRPVNEIFRMPNGYFRELGSKGTTRYPSLF